MLVDASSVCVSEETHAKSENPVFQWVVVDVATVEGVSAEYAMIMPDVCRRIRMAEMQNMRGSVLVDALVNEYYRKKKRGQFLGARAPGFGPFFPL